MALGAGDGGMQAGIEAVAESYILNFRQRETLAVAWLFDTSKPTPSDTSSSKVTPSK